MKKKLNTLSIIGLLLGIIGGIYLPKVMENINFIGQVYVNILRLLIIPLIFTSIASTLFKPQKNSKKIIIKAIVLFIIMFIVTFILTTVIYFIANPLSNINESLKLLEWSGEIAKISFSDMIINLFPNNIASIFTNNSILATIIFAFVFGYAASKTEDGEKVMDVINALKKILYKILDYILLITPFAVFSLVGNSIANYGMGLIGIGIKYILLAYISGIVVITLVMIVPVWIFSKINPLLYVKKIAKVWLISSTTCSSAATLPYTIKVCNEEFDVSEKITNFVVPLGSVIHMCGGAVSFALLGLFCSQLFGLHISFTTYLLMMVSATLINMSAPGIPGGGIVLGATYLSMFNIPLSFMGLYAGIYRILDMLYTTLNVTGDVTANILINRSEK